MVITFNLKQGRHNIILKSYGIGTTFPQNLKLVKSSCMVTTFNLKEIVRCNNDFQLD